MKALVTGGGGFLGGAIVRRLIERGDRVRSFARGSYPSLTQLGVEVCRGDLADARAVAAAVNGCDVVYHVAAKAGLGGRYRDYYRANVTGTRHVLTACCAAGVQKLIYTSSPSVVFDGKDMEGVDESVPYPSHHHAAYPRTKAMAERLILAANCTRLATVALRPHLIWGPRDTHLVPRLVARARAGRLLRIGTTNKLIDTVYVDNAAEAHLLAADRLSPGSVIAGKTYFITQGEPAPLWDVVNGILAAAGLPPVRRTIATSVAIFAGAVLELACAIGWPDAEPPMTRFLARELSTAHWFTIDAARTELGYEPKVTTKEGLRRLANWFRTPNDVLPSE